MLTPPKALSPWGEGWGEGGAELRCPPCQVEAQSCLKTRQQIP